MSYLIVSRLERISVFYSLQCPLLVGWPISYTEIRVPKGYGSGTVFLGKRFDRAFIAGRGSEYDWDHCANVDFKFVHNLYKTKSPRGSNRLLFFVGTMAHQRPLLGHD